MPIDSIEKFADNWAYLKIELNWLDRVLMLAVARQRKESKDIDRISQSRADRVTSHWWKGVITLEGGGSYDEQKRSPVVSAVSYQQQLETRIRASRQQSVMLALPLLCDRLKLSPFEKNLILMSLAPSVNRRYARLYRYLQGEDFRTELKTDLPSVDLALRLMCHNDQEWRSARNCFTPQSPLLQHHLLTLLPADADTLLNQSVKLSASLIDFLLSEQPTASILEGLLKPPTRSIQFASAWTPIDWSMLILPDRLLVSLQHLPQRAQAWKLEPPGTLVLLTGAPGTGKTMAAGAIAHALQTPLVSIDFARLNPEAYAPVLKEVAAQAPKVLLLQSAELALGRSSLLSDAEITRFLDRRRSLAGVTLLETRVNHAIRLRWRQQLYQTCDFPIPTRDDCLRLWQQAFPVQVALDPEIDWAWVARSAISGGEIRSIARESMVYWTASGAASLGWSHLMQAFEQFGKPLKAPPARPAKKRKSKPRQPARSVSKTVTNELFAPDNGRLDSST